MRRIAARHHVHRRGMALLMAVLMISVVAGSLAALTLAFAAQAKRTTRQAQDAQLRQLLLAGQVAAQQAVGQARAGELSLPADLRSGGASVRFEAIPGSGDPDEMRVRVIAVLGEHRPMTQTLRFARNANRWELRSAEL